MFRIQIRNVKCIRCYTGDDERKLDCERVNSCDLDRLIHWSVETNRLMQFFCALQPINVLEKEKCLARLSKSIIEKEIFQHRIFFKLIIRWSVSMPLMVLLLKG